MPKTVSSAAAKMPQPTGSASISSLPAKLSARGCCRPKSAPKRPACSSCMAISPANSPTASGSAAATN
ncbi:hypothetical protein D3C83_220090 [compost metagenome]